MQHTLYIHSHLVIENTSSHIHDKSFRFLLSILYWIKEKRKKKSSNLNMKTFYTSWQQMMHESINFFIPSAAFYSFNRIMGLYLSSGLTILEVKLTKSMIKSNVTQFFWNDCDMDGLFILKRATLNLTSNSLECGPLLQFTIRCKWNAFPLNFLFSF